MTGPTAAEAAEAAAEIGLVMLDAEAAVFVAAEELSRRYVAGERDLDRDLSRLALQVAWLRDARGDHNAALDRMVAAAAHEEAGR